MEFSITLQQQAQTTYNQQSQNSNQTNQFSHNGVNYHITQNTAENQKYIFLRKYQELWSEKNKIITASNELIKKKDQVNGWASSQIFLKSILGTSALYLNDGDWKKARSLIDAKAKKINDQIKAMIKSDPDMAAYFNGVPTPTASEVTIYMNQIKQSAQL